MTGGPDPLDEFGLIARLMRPLTRGAPEALELLDDAAVLPSRPGFDLVVTKDMIVEGVHFLPSDPLDLVARKLLRVNLSDLAAKAAQPYGWFLSIAWPHGRGLAEREAFAAGLMVDQGQYGLSLFGGDTTATPGPLTASATLMGWVPQGRMLKRSGARPGDMVLVSGVIGDGWLGLKAALGQIKAEGALQRYRLPEPRLALRDALSAAHAGADVSDGLIADAGHIAAASGVAIDIDLERIPLSVEGLAYIGRAGDRVAALSDLVTGGDDYELVVTAAPERAGHLVAAAETAGIRMTAIGRVGEGQGVRVLYDGRETHLERRGYRHS